MSPFSITNTNPEAKEILDKHLAENQHIFDAIETLAPLAYALDTLIRAAGQLPEYKAQAEFYEKRHMQSVMDSMNHGAKMNSMLLSAILKSDNPLKTAADMIPDEQTDKE